MQQAQRGERAIDLVGEEVLGQVEVQREGLVQPRADREHLVEIALHRVAEARQFGPCVVGPGRAVGPDQVEGFLVVRRGLLVERLDAEADVAAVAAEPVDGHLPLDLGRLREEARALGEGRIDQRHRHAVAGDHEEADLAAGPADLRGQRAARGRVVERERRDVDEGNVVHGLHSPRDTPPMLHAEQRLLDLDPRRRDDARQVAPLLGQVGRELRGRHRHRAKPASARRRTMSGSASTAVISRAMRSTIAGSVFAGTSRPCHDSTSSVLNSAVSTSSARQAAWPSAGARSRRSRGPCRRG